MPAVLGLLLSMGACHRESRDLRAGPPPAGTSGVVVSELLPAGGSVPPAPPRPEESNAWALGEGKRLYSQYNCSGCHANGGGGMGPPLMDEQWTYGEQSDQIYRTILEGRPNGMPAWRNRIPDQQIWQLAAYVRSMSGLVPKDAAPSRSDHMTANPPEHTMPRRAPKGSAPPATR